MSQTILGNKLYLRELEAADLDRTHEWLHRPDIYNKIGVQVPFTIEQQEQWFNNLKHDKSKIVFAICLKDDEIHIGNVSLDSIDYRHKNARFSIFIADGKDRGKGYGAEAIKLIETYAFNNLGLHKIWCKTDAEELLVQNFYQKAGYKKEGLLIEHESRNHVFIDKVIFAKINRWIRE